MARIGLALGSGSARGWSHVGVIEALLEAGIEPDIVAGTSMGALVGAAYVGGRLDALRNWAEQATWRNIGALLDLRVAGGGLIDGARIREFLQELGVDGAIEDQPKTFGAVATDLVSGREIWLREGDILDAVRASISLPGIFSPATWQDRLLVDGGLVNPVPVSLCRALGADCIIAVNLNEGLVGRRFTGPEYALRDGATGTAAAVLDQLPVAVREPAARLITPLLRSGPKSPGYFDVLANSINIMQDQITRARLAGEPPHVQILPQLRDISLMDFQRAGEAIEEGRQRTRSALADIRRAIERA